MHLIKGSFRTYASASVLEQKSAAIYPTTSVPPSPYWSAVVRAGLSQVA